MRDEGACCSTQMGNGSLLQIQEKATRGLSHEGRRTWGSGRGLGDLEIYQQPHQGSVSVCASEMQERSPNQQRVHPVLVRRPQEPAGLWVGVPEALCSQLHPCSRAWTIHFFLHSLFSPRPALLDPGDAITGSSWSPGAHGLVGDTDSPTSADG